MRAVYEGLSTMFRQVIRNVNRQEIYERLQRKAALFSGELVDTPFGPIRMTPMEVKLYHAIVAKGLNPVPQHCVRGYYIDFAFPDLRLGVEADGKDYHSGANKLRDTERDQHLQKSGWTILRFEGSAIWRDSNRCATEVLEKVKAAEGPVRDTTAHTMILSLASLLGAMLLTFLMRSLGL